LRFFQTLFQTLPCQAAAYPDRHTCFVDISPAVCYLSSTHNGTQPTSAVRDSRADALSCGGFSCSTLLGDRQSNLATIQSDAHAPLCGVARSGAIIDVQSKPLCVQIGFSKYTNPLPFDLDCLEKTHEFFLGAIGLIPLDEEGQRYARQLRHLQWCEGNLVLPNNMELAHAWVEGVRSGKRVVLDRSDTANFFLQKGLLDPKTFYSTLNIRHVERITFKKAKKILTPQLRKLRKTGFYTTVPLTNVVKIQTRPYTHPRKGTRAL
jgi:hypothetical protein